MLGGAYENVGADGGQVHHMPADSISPYDTGKGPGIRMETGDHKKTASWGRKRTAQEYREKQKQLIAEGKFKEAQQMDIDDIHAYTDKLLKESSDETVHPSNGKCGKK